MRNEMQITFDNQLHSIQSSSLYARSFSPEFFNSHLKRIGPKTISERALTHGKYPKNEASVL